MSRGYGKGPYFGEDKPSAFVDASMTTANEPSEIGMFQHWCWDWMRRCFVRPGSLSVEQRAFRFLEESLELAQACGTTRDEALQLVEYVYARPVGEVKQEIGGVMVTIPIKFNAAYYDARFDKFYYVTAAGGEIYEWDATGQPLLTTEWKSKVFINKEYTNIGAARVIADFSTDQEALDAIIAFNAAVVTQKLQQLASGFIYTDQGAMQLSSHKFDALADLLDENQHANTIVFYNYIEELNELKRRFPDARTVESIDEWNAGRVRLLCLHPKSAGHGLNLQHGGCHLVWLSLPWSLELYEQSIGRLHRSGQRHDVWCYVLLTKGTVDERIFAALQDKRTLSDIAMESLK